MKNFKSQFVVFIITFVLMLTCFSVSASASSVCNIVIDGKTVVFDSNSGEPFIDENNRTLVPLRKTMESYGCEVSWDQSTRTATVTMNGSTVLVGIGNNYIIANGSQVKIDTKAQIVNSRTYLPIRAVLEAFGADVEWINSTRTVDVTSGSGKPDLSTVLSAEEVFNKCSSSVFYIEVYDKNGKAFASGSGFFVGSDGTAVTNYHVIEDACSAKIKTTDGKVYNVSGVYDINKDKDIALIKVNGSGFSYLQKGNSDSVKTGSTIYAIGSPLGLDNTISAGIVSNASRYINGKNYIQISAPISSGSSGGALIDSSGKAVGITSAGVENGQNLNFAIPINFVDSMSKGKIKSLSSLFGSQASSAAKVTVGQTNVTLNVDDSVTINVHDTSTDEDVTLLYNVANSSVVAAEWNEWSDFNNTSITLYGLKPGTTTVTIGYDNGYSSSTETIKVTVNSRIKGYAAYPSIPDFGAYFGVGTYDVYHFPDSSTYYYSTRSLVPTNPNGEFIEEYTDLLIASGYEYFMSFENDDGDTVLVYDNYYTGKTVYFWIGYPPYSSTLCVGIMII